MSRKGVGGREGAGKEYGGREQEGGSRREGVMIGRQCMVAVQSFQSSHLNTAIQ